MLIQWNPRLCPYRGDLGITGRSHGGEHDKLRRRVPRSSIISALSAQFHPLKPERTNILSLPTRVRALSSLPIITSGNHGQHLLILINNLHLQANMSCCRASGDPEET